MLLELTKEEHDLLLEILSEHHRSLVMEISHTDHHDFKKVLRKKEDLLDAILSRLHRREAVVA